MRSRAPTAAPAASEGSRALLQQRVSLLAKVSTYLGLVVQALAFWTRHSFANSHIAGARWTAEAHLFVLASVAAIWWRTRSGQRSPLELGVYDVICVMIVPAFWMVGLWDVPYEVRPAPLVVLGSAYLLILRSVLVPSTGLRTALLGTAVMSPIVLWTYLHQVRHAPPGADPAVLAAVAVFAWNTIGISIATVASHTIFGLRQEVKQATQLGQYTLLRKIGEGGMGVVWEARHSFLRRRTAVKLLPAERAGQEAVTRFEREVQLTSGLTHPNTIAIYDYGRSADGVFYYAMEYLDGIDLQQLVERDGPQSPGLVAHVLGQVCDALSEAHEVGLIHRDVKPANVILCERGGAPLVAKVLDFGLVKHRPGGAAEAEVVSTATGLIGTPLYMAPETMTAPDRLDGRSDLYAVGALGYFLLTGRPVFEGATVLDMLGHHLHSKPVAPSERLGAPVPADLEALILGCLEKDPDRRPASAAALSASLAATGARSTFTLQTARAAWKRCRALASAARAAPVEPHALTVAMSDRA